jgi:hypothetical protein
MYSIIYMLETHKISQNSIRIILSTFIDFIIYYLKRVTASGGKYIIEKTKLNLQKKLFKNTKCKTTLNTFRWMN